MKTPLSQIKNARVLADAVTDSLREAILEGLFQPGEKLDQGAITAELGISRTPLREALLRLESEGFLMIRAHRGVYVAPVTLQDIRDVYDIRKLLEVEAVRQVTPTIPESLLDYLAAQVEESWAQIEAGDTSSHFASDIAFHETIINRVENRLLKEMLEGLNNRVLRVRRFALRQPGSHLYDSLAEHRVVIRCMRERDAEGAMEAMRSHLEESARRIQHLATQMEG